MSDINPRGVSVEVCGISRTLLFTVNAIDAVQDKYGMNVYGVLGEMLNNRERQPEMVRFVFKTLLDAEADRAKLLTGEELRRFTEEEVGMLLDINNILDVIIAIYEAYNISMPEASDEDESDPK